jgi:hypothetical protein
LREGEIVREEFLITRSGKQYVLYQGLLDQAHTEGLSGIDTEIVQVPTADNGNVAICKATVYMSRLDEDTWLHKSFMGIGDASPENVGRNIVPHIIRMAETRAKARALRDAVNVGTTALEELGDVPEGDAQSPAPGASGAAEASDRQKGMIRGLLNELGIELLEFEMNHGIKIDNLSKSRASKAIEWLQKQKEG